MAIGPKEEGILNTGGKVMVTIALLAGVLALGIGFGDEVIDEIQEATETTTVETPTVPDITIPDVTIPDVTTPRQPGGGLPGLERRLERRGRCLTRAQGDPEKVLRCFRRFG